jgi:hypothetical protein
MTFHIATASELGTECWAPQRFNNQCHRCARYDICKLSSRRAYPAFDAQRLEAQTLKAQSDALFKSLKEL